LAQLARRDGTELNIGRAREGEALGEHSLSGRGREPPRIRELFPDLKDGDFPFRGLVEKERVALSPPAGRSPSHAAHDAQRRELRGIVVRDRRWLGERAAAFGVNVFTGFPAASLLVMANGSQASDGADRPGPRRRPLRTTWRRTTSSPR